MIVVLALTTTMINVAAWAGGDEKGDQGGSEAVSESHADDGALGTEVVYRHGD